MNKKYSNQLPDDLNQQVMALSKEGGRFQMGHKNLKAVESYLKAYELLPEPKDQWNYTSVLLGNAAKNYYLKAFFNFEEHMNDPSEIGVGSNHSRIGQLAATFERISNLTQF